MEASNGKEKTIKAFDAKKALKVLERVNKFLGILIRENLVKDAPFLDEGELENESDLADDVWEVLQMKPRNCDVGTAEEQWSRFKKHCDENSQADDPDYCSSRCDVNGGCVTHCALKWAQMPYEEGGAE